MPDNEVDWTREFAQSTLRDALARAIDESTPGLIGRLAKDSSGYAELLTATDLLVKEAEQMLRETAIAARHAGFSWERVGAALGLSRQDAQLRFGSATDVVVAKDQVPGRDPSLPPVGTRVTSTLDELPQLSRAGLYGWHAVGMPGGYFELEFDDQQWHHTTTTGRTPDGDGWQRVARFALWVYWARPTGLPILPGNPEVRAFASDGKLRKALKASS